MAFSFPEIIELNSILEHASGTNHPHSILIDNLHTSFAQLEEDYILPSTSVFQVDFEAASNFLQNMILFIPEAIQGCSVLQNHRPKRETGNLTLFRSFDIENSLFLYTITFHIAYLGGATPESILFPPPQEKTPSVRTNKIYFSVRIVPLKNLEIQEKIITNFSTKEYFESTKNISTAIKNPFKESISELFDEIDFSELIATLKETWKITPDLWKLGRIFNPLAVEYNTISFKFLELNLENVIREFSSFYKLADSLFSDNIPELENAISNYHNWLKSHLPERIQSSSGNMSWKIIRYNTI